MKAHRQKRKAQIETISNERFHKQALKYNMIGRRMVRQPILGEKMVDT